MGQKEKLIERFHAFPKDFSFEELVRLLSFLDFQLYQRGRTSGSRVVFIHKESGIKIILHKPHGRTTLLDYQMKQVAACLKQEGLL